MITNVNDLARLGGDGWLFELYTISHILCQVSGVRTSACICCLSFSEISRGRLHIKSHLEPLPLFPSILYVFFY